jgi:hypothetical protein
MNKWLKRIYKSLPITHDLGKLDAIYDYLKAIHREVQINNMIQAETAMRDELGKLRYRDPKRLSLHEHQVFSQNGEDGIIAEIFTRIGLQSKTFVEIGTGNGLENNTAFLVAQGWRGYWLEGDRECVELIRAQFGEKLTGTLKLRCEFITAENIAALLHEMGVPAEFDLLSLDIDRNTYYVWRALREFRPRVVVIEYNATFPADVDWCVDYRPERSWNYTSYMGASLKAYERLGSEIGYSLVGCDMTGTNAFFVRKCEAVGKFAEPFTAENHYEPTRYWAVRRKGHPAAFTD